MALSIDDIESLFTQRGAEQYGGEPVNQVQHALQCALLAEREGGDDELVTAAFLHDLGHLLHDIGDTPTMRGIDDLHQYRALPFLRGLFGSGVTDPIRLHVDAKRYLCATRPGYHDALSADSKRSLQLQGGVFTPQQAAHFAAQPGAAQAVKVRVWDDLAKVDGLPTPPLAHYIERARRCTLPPA